MDLLIRTVLQGYILQLFRNLIDQQSWTDDGSVSQRMLRSYLLLFACVRGHPPCVSTATQLFNKWKESDGNMRSEVICTDACIPTVKTHLLNTLSSLFFFIAQSS